MSVRFHGKAPFTVALLHGGPGAVGSMRVLAERLSLQSGVLELLQRALTVDDQIDEARRDIRENADGAVTVIGHSWGAWLGWLLAARTPDVVRTLVMIGTPPLEERWEDTVTAERIRRLPRAESQEFRMLVDSFAGSADHGSAADLARLGELAARADAYDELFVPVDEGGTSSGVLDARMFVEVWREASALRRGGKLLQEGKRIRCPVVAVHGDYDPHPLEGVRQPAAGVLTEFRMIVLERCGHTPWRERYASALLFQALQQEIAGAMRDRRNEEGHDRQPPAWK